MRGVVKLDKIIKHSKTMGELVIKEIPYKEAKEMIIKNHYSHKWNTSFGKINFGIFKDDVLLGCATYGNLMNPKSQSSITDDGEVIELNRLWVDDKLGKNAETIFLSATFKLIKENYKHIVAIQSFADGRLGVGTIYKASNFKYYGYDESLFFDVGNEVFHKVPLENTKRPNGFMIKNLYIINNKFTAFYVNTYRYIMPLYKNVNIKLQEQPYPSYQKGVNVIDFVPSIGTYTRLSLCYKIFGLEDLSTKTIEYLTNYYSMEEIQNSLKTQKENKSLIEIKNNYANKEILRDKVIQTHKTIVDKI